MHFKANRIPILIGVLLCSYNNNVVAQKMDDHIFLYTTTSDSIKAYSNSAYVQELLSDSLLYDYIHLDYHGYKEKYSLEDTEMDRIAESLMMIPKLATISQYIEDNYKKAEQYTSSRKDSLPQKSIHSDSTLIEILMNSRDAETDSLPN